MNGVQLNDPIAKRVLIASKYLEGDKKGVRTLDQYAAELDPDLYGNLEHHVCFVAGNTRERGKLGLDTLDLSLKQSLTDAIVLSALVGDHDINPGNMMVITRDGVTTIARIDFGHAFNDLLNAHEMFGGAVQLTNFTERVKISENPIFDFFNREHIAGAAIGGSPSKLWRDYPGIVLTQEMVNSLKKLGQKSDDAMVGMLQAKEDYKKLITMMRENDDPAGIQHVKKSLGAMYKNITNKTVDLNQDIDSILDTTFDAFKMFVEKNCDNALNAAEVLQLQVDIDTELKNESPDINKILKQFNKLADADGNLQWLKIDKDTPAFKGNLYGYIQQRNQKLGQTAGGEFLQKSIAFINIRRGSDDILRLLTDYARDRTSSSTEKERSSSQSSLRLSVSAGYSYGTKMDAVTLLSHLLSGAVPEMSEVNRLRGALGQGKLKVVLEEIAAKYIGPNTSIDELLSIMIKGAEEGAFRGIHKTTDLMADMFELIQEDKSLVASITNDTADRRDTSIEKLRQVEEKILNLGISELLQFHPDYIAEKYFSKIATPDGTSFNLRIETHLGKELEKLYCAQNRELILDVIDAAKNNPKNFLAKLFLKDPLLKRFLCEDWETAEKFLNSPLLNDSNYYNLWLDVFSSHKGNCREGYLEEILNAEENIEFLAWTMDSDVQDKHRSTLATNMTLFGGQVPEEPQKRERSDAVLVSPIIP